MYSCFALIGCFYANVSASGVRSGFARLALNGMCEQGAVDLSIVDGDLDLDNEYPIVMGEPLLDQIPDLEVITSTACLGEVYMKCLNIDKNCYGSGFDP